MARIRCTVAHGAGRVTSGPGGAGRPSSSGRPLPAPNPVLAVALTLVACAFFAGTNVGAKLIATAPGPALHPLQIVFGRFLFGTLLLAPLLLIEGPSLLRSRVPYAYLLRSGCSVGAAACIYASVAVLPLADVTALTYSSPLFMLILAALLLRERVDGWRWLAVVVGFAGVVVMTAPSLDTIQPMALVALLAAVLMSGELIALRFIARRDPPLSALFLTNLVGLGLSTLCTPFVWQPATASQWELMLLIGAVTVSGQVFFVRAVAMGEASLLAPLYYSTLVYAAGFGWLLFAEVPSTRSLLGAALIVGAGLTLHRGARPAPALLRPRPAAQSRPPAPRHHC